MCDIPPLPALGLATPWQAPIAWGGFLLFVLLTAWVTVGRRFLPRGLRRRTALVPPPGRALLMAASLCSAGTVALLWLVYLPASFALDAWDSALDATPMSKACLETAHGMYKARSGQLEQVLIATVPFLVVFILLVGIQMWRFPARRNASAGPSALSAASLPH